MCAGGSVYYAAKTWQSLGASAAIATAVGTDFSCEPALRDIELMRCTAGATTTFLNQHDEHGNVVRHIEGVAPRVEPAVLTEAWKRCDVLLLAPVFGEVEIAAWLDAIHAPLIALSLQGLLREAIEGRVVPRALSLPREVLSRCGVVVLSEQDVAPAELPSLLGILREVVPVVVVTRGRAGCTVFTHEGNGDVGVFPARVVDPTGAGDGFTAGMSLAMAAGLRAMDAARWGAVVASVIVEGRGGDRLGHVGALAAGRLGAIAVDASP